MNTKAKTRLNVLRALTKTSIGHTKEDITQVYKQYIRPIFLYAHLSWEPSTANTLMELLQTTQSFALHIATDCTSFSPIYHVHHRTHVLPIRQHMCTPQQNTPITPSTAFDQHRLANRDLRPTPNSCPALPIRTGLPPPTPRQHIPPQSASAYTLHTPKEHLTVPNQICCFGPGFPSLTPH